MKQFLYLTLLAFLALAPAEAQQQTISLPVAHPGQRYLEQLSPEVEGHFKLPFQYAYRDGFAGPQWLQLDQATGVISGTPPLASRQGSKSKSLTPQVHSFLIDVSDGTGSIVRTLVLKLVVSSEPERLTLALDPSGSKQQITAAATLVTPAKQITTAQIASARPSQPKVEANNQPDPPITIVKPTFTKPPGKGDAVVKVHATSSIPGQATVTVKLLSVATTGSECSAPDGTLGLPLKGGDAENSLPTDANGDVQFTLITPPAETDSFICALQTIHPQSPFTADQASIARGSAPVQVLEPVAITRPTIVSKLSPGESTVAVQSMPTKQDAGTDHVTLYQVNSSKQDTCDGVPVEVASGSNPVSTNDAGVAAFALKTPLAGGERLCAAHDFKPASGTVDKVSQDKNSHSGIVSVPEALEWGRVRAYFAGGVLIANNNTNNANDSAFSSAHQFYSFNIEKAWKLPECYVHECGPAETTSEDAVASEHRPAHWYGRWPGFTTYFDTRLTAIPVAATPAQQPTTGNAAPSTTTSPSGTGGSNPAFLTTQKTARLGVGAYFPILLPRWTWDHEPNALFIAPMAKIGFDSLAAPTQQSFTVTNSANPSSSGSASTVTQNFNQLYNFFGYGARIGHYKLTRDSNKSPEIISYLDVIFGKYSNLPSFTCVARSTGTGPGTGPAPTLLTGSSCNTAYPTLPAGSAYGDVQTRLYRLDLEGILKVPYTPAFVGFNANIGQRTIAPKLLDRTLQPPDDLRFVFGFRVDLGTVLNKMGVKSPFE